MHKFSPRFFISLMMLLMSIVATVTVTYAWFKFPTKNWIDDISIQVTQGKAVELSIDGVNFTHSISLEDVHKVIVLDSKGWSYELDGDFSTLVDEDGNYVDDSNIDYETLFKQIELSPVTSIDGLNFYDRDYNVADRTDNGAYINIPLYAKLDTKLDSSDTIKERVLYLNNSTVYKTTEEGEQVIDVSPTGITATDAEVSILNNLTTYDDFGNSVYIKSNGSVTVNPRDAIRLSINSDYASAIFEPYLGLGSYAVNYTDYVASAYNLGSVSIDSSMNAAFTHYNNIIGKDINPISAKSYFDLEENIYHNFDSKDSREICEINGITPTKFSISIWLEGYDADCLDYLNGTSMDITLSFTSNPRPEADEYDVTYYYQDGSFLTNITAFTIGSVVSNTDLDTMYIPEMLYRERNLFLYWSRDKENPLTDLSFSEDTSLYAVWALDMNFYLNDGNFESDPGTFIAGTTINPVDPVRDGYTFNGWYSDSSLSKPYEPTELYEGIDLYASWVQS